MNQIYQRIQQGRGAIPADKVLRGGQVFDLMTGSMISGDVAICGEYIVGIGADYDAKEVIDVSGMFIVPGFIDTHLHIESSLLTPLEFDRCVTPRGITTAICDPHEMANVLGVAGIEYFQNASEQTLLDLKVQLSPCVPATAMETSGAEILAADLVPLMGHPSNIGLAELMNYPGVLHGDSDMLAKLELFAGGHIDGHSPLLRGKDLNGYIASGVRTEHEATDVAEALEKLQKGMRILIREGTVSRDLDALQPLLSDVTSPYMCLCTDDRNPLDVAEHGHLDYMIRRLIELGTSPLAAYRAATLSAAEAFGLKDRGQIAPGKRADIVCLPDLAECRAELVLCAGVEVNDAAFAARGHIPEIGRNSVHVPKVSESDFMYQGKKQPVPVIGVLADKIITEFRRLDLPSLDEDIPPDLTQDALRVSVIERHGKNGNIANGFVQGFGLKQGAIAASVAHDHHNIVCIGANYADMVCAVERLGAIEGGFVVTNNETVLAELPLPIAGLISQMDFEQVHDHLVDLRMAARSLGVMLPEPFIQLAFLALSVIPSLKITDHGLIDVDRFELLDI